MFLVYRPAGLSDLQECQYCLRDSFAYSDTKRQELMRLWRFLLTSGAGGMAVIEDKMREPGNSILWVCFKVFITEDYAEYLKTAAQPILGLEMLRQRNSETLPVLSQEQVRQANSYGGDGVVMLVLNSGFSPDALKLNEADFNLLFAKMIEFNYYFCAGYHFVEILIEMYNKDTYSWADGAGLHLRTDYSQHFQRTGIAVPPDQCPKLYGVTPAERQPTDGRIFSAITNYREPLFWFSEGEQELLFRALLDETDEDSAEALCISPNTIKKRWNSIYNRIDAVAAEVLGTSQESDLEGVSAISILRGKEKKRRVIAYLRHHMEELRPCQRTI